MSKSSVFCACCAAVGLLISGALADAAQPSAAKMSQMGLSGATVVSDSVAMDVRGFGYRGGSRGGNRVTIWGSSSVEVEVQLGPVEIELESSHGYHSTTNGSQVGFDLSFVGATVIGGGNNTPPGGAGLTNTNGGHGTPIFFAGGVSGVKVGGRRGGGH